ncbi:MEDS domain-containing protein [Streptomyces sp. NPDC058045]|uniref:MEDS domain-containing protein n=1 Tax=Streptomyces sp. NPDC058045 TaxID=3346311 RepID=UPI0036E16705
MQHIRPGDHAFLGYGGEGGWDVLSAFVWAGLAHGERVIVVVPPGLGTRAAFARLQSAPGPLLATGRATGQLTLATMPELLGPHAPFTVERQAHRIAEEITKARRAGLPGVRACIDRGWTSPSEGRGDSPAEDMGAAPDPVAVARAAEEASAHLFADGFYRQICAYDRRRFPPATLAAHCAAHPRNLLPALGQLRALPGPDTLRLIGEADLATRDTLTDALATLTPPDAHPAAPHTVDLTGLTFLGTECAAALVEAARPMPGRSGVTLRCRPRDALLLRHLGATPDRLDITAD